MSDAKTTDPPVKMDEEGKPVKHKERTPYFKVLPDPYSAKPQPPEDWDYMDQVMAAHMQPDDADGIYGVEPRELVPLPFKPPSMIKLMLYMVLGTVSYAQMLLLLLVSIMVEVNQRSWHASDWYNANILPLSQVLVIVYPCVTMLVLTLLNCEAMYRQFFYYRFLSLRILVDFKNRPVTTTAFFFYFVATWVILNVYCIYGVVWFGTLGLPGNQKLSLATWGVANIGTLQLLKSYIDLRKQEKKKLVTLNLWMERDPVAATQLLDVMHLVDEDHLTRECASYLMELKHDQGTACFDWQDLKLKARNRTAIEARTAAAAGTAGLVPLAHDGIRQDLPPGAADPETGAPAALALEVEKSRDGKEHKPGFMTVVYGKAHESWYATLHVLKVAFGAPKGWPFQPDIKVMHAMLLTQLFCVATVGLLVWYGIEIAFSDPANCDQGYSDCSTCWQFYEQVVITERQCPQIYDQYLMINKNATITPQAQANYTADWIEDSGWNASLCPATSA